VTEVAATTTAAEEAAGLAATVDLAAVNEDDDRATADVLRVVAAFELALRFAMLVPFTGKAEETTGIAVVAAELFDDPL
jgi:hypothetical protein